MNKKQIILTAVSVAMTGAMVSTFFYNYEENSTLYKFLNSNGFGLATGLLVAYTTYLYTHQ